MINEIINNAATASSVIIVLGVLWLVLVIALIICVFNISIRQSHQDRGQDQIIKLIEEHAQQQEEILEDILAELRYLNDSNDDYIAPEDTAQDDYQDF